MLTKLIKSMDKELSELEYIIASEIPATAKTLSSLADDMTNCVAEAHPHDYAHRAHGAEMLLNYSAEQLEAAMDKCNTCWQSLTSVLNIAINAAQDKKAGPDTTSATGKK